MAPLQRYPQQVKNTFLHIECNNPVQEAELDESEWLSRRHASEPPPMKRQPSHAAPDNAALPYVSCSENTTEKLEKTADDGKMDTVEIEAFHPSLPFHTQGELDMTDSCTYVNHPSCFTRQTSALSDVSAVMGPQVPSQVSSLSTTSLSPAIAGLCRQVTEEQWPTYHCSYFMQEQCYPTAMLPSSNAAAALVNSFPNWQQQHQQQQQQAEPYHAHSSPLVAQEEVIKRTASDAEASPTSPLASPYGMQMLFLPPPSPLNHSPGAQSGLIPNIVPAPQVIDRGKFCANCGSVVKQHFNFCQICGKPTAALTDFGNGGAGGYSRVE